MPLESVSCAGRVGKRCPTLRLQRSVFAPSFDALPDVDRELFEQVTDEELALLNCHRAPMPNQRAALLEALARMVEPARLVANCRHGGRSAVH